jgi:uncharacterized protein
MTKWGERPHWSFGGTYLGSDEHGDWIGYAAGTVFTRPGQQFTAPNDQVGLVPAEVDGVRPGCLPTFHAPGGTVWSSLGGDAVAVYVDMTTPPVWEGATLRAVDLDLDVVRGQGGQVIVDDEDEFAEHQVSFGYPDEVVRLAEGSCRRVRAAMLAGEAPYDGASHLPWLERLATR